MSEIWIDIPNYNGVYKVSNFGNVKSIRNGKELILKNILDKHGYYFVNLSLKGKSKPFKIHILVSICFLNHTPSGYKVVVDHINNIKTDNKLENLQLISNRENTSKDKTNCSSKYTGVNYEKDRKKWASRIYINGKRKTLGRFNTELEAYLKYKEALHSHLNKN